MNNTETKQGLWFLCLQHKDCGKCLYISECFLVRTLWSDDVWNVDVGNALPYKGMWCHIFCPSWLAVDVERFQVESVRLCFEYYIFDSNIWIYGQGVCVNHIRLRWSNIFLVFFFFLSTSLIFLFRMKEIYIVYINVHPLHLFFLCVCVFYVHYFLPGQFGTTAQYKQYFFSNYLLN